MTTNKTNVLGNIPYQPVRQRNYHEHVTHNDNDVYDTRKYIRENPHGLVEKVCFTSRWKSFPGEIPHEIRWQKRMNKGLRPPTTSSGFFNTPPNWERDEYNLSNVLPHEPTIKTRGGLCTRILKLQQAGHSCFPYFI